MKKLLIVGAGGHGKVVAEIAKNNGWRTVSFVDDHYPDLTSVMGVPVIGRRDDLDRLRREFVHAFVALGNNTLRMQFTEEMMKLEYQFPSIIHPRAVISPSAVIGEGTVVMANAVINACATVGNGCIVNTSAIVEHDDRIEDWVHLSPAARLGGGVRIGVRTWIGLGASVIQNIDIGSDAVIGAGAVVISNVGIGQKMIGVPAVAMPQSTHKGSDQ